MKLYKFYNAQYGIEAIKNGRIKVSTLSDLNDPFDCRSISFTDHEQRQNYKEYLSEYMKEKGILCFSKSWSNPVLWSHYANSHKGLCLELEAEDGFCREVNYISKVSLNSIPDIKKPTEGEKNILDQSVYKKFSHWKYESETRKIVNLSDCDNDNGLQFYKLNDKLKLKKVYIGSNYEKEIKEMNIKDIEFVTTRLAFRDFKIVRQMNKKLYKSL
jgi:hypothetical protein